MITDAFTDKSTKSEEPPNRPLHLPAHASYARAKPQVNACDVSLTHDNTMARYTKPDADDDPEYLAWTDAIVAGVVRSAELRRWYVVKIDNWFGKRRLGFSGKALGALGVRKQRLTLPPFVPSRVVSQYRYWRADSEPGRQRGLHVHQRSGENLQRYVDVVVQDSSVFWYSGRSAANKRASFMAYVWTADGHWPWYVGLQSAGTWRVSEAVGIRVSELDVFSGRAG